MAAKKQEKSNSSSPSLAKAAEENIARIAIDEDGMVVYASEAFCGISKINAKDICNRDYSAILCFADKTDYLNALNDITSGIHSVYINGESKQTQFHFDWITTPQNKRYLVGSQISDKKKRTPSKASLNAFQKSFLQNDAPQNKQSNLPSAQEKNRPTQKQTAKQDFIAFSSLSKDLMMVLDENGKILRTNKAFYDLLGYDETTIAKLSFFDLFNADDIPHIHNTLRSLTLDKTPESSPSIDFEASLYTKDGYKRDMVLSQQQVNSLFYCIGRDITNIKVQQKALERREKQLSEAESIGGMGHWHWSVGQDGVQWSDEIYRIFGVEKGTFTPTLQTMNAMINRRDIGRVNQAFQRAIIEHNNYDMEFRIKRPDGEVRYIRCEGRCASDEEGDVNALYGIMQDMTERIVYEQQLMEAKNAAERAYSAKSQFLANMSHELRTPLNAIIGFSEMMIGQLLGPIGSEKYLDYLNGIHDSGEHLLDLISDILDMSKIEAGKYDLDFENINISKIIGVAMQMVEARAQEAGIKVRGPQNLDDTLKIVADRRGVLQILLNLLSNAVKFSREGCEVRIDCTPREDYLSLKIIDNGIGIPPNKLQTITRPFEQASNQYTRDHEGSGLGLAITKELIELHGGVLNIESQLGEGTTVSIRLPYNAHEELHRKANSK